MTCTTKSYTVFECLFIFSVSKLLLNAASYDGEIGTQLHDNHVQDFCWFLCL